MRRVVLSHPLPVFALVSLYLTNKLIGYFPLSRWQAFARCAIQHYGVIRYYHRFLDAIPGLEVR